MSLLSIRSISAGYDKVRALDAVSLHVEPGELVALVGTNGAGKSTLMKVVMGIVRAVSGEMQFDGTSIVGLPTHAIARLGIAYVPEGRGTLRELTVRENLLLGGFSRKWDRQARNDLDEILERFPALKVRLHQPAGTLSGGEQQMLVIGRALMLRPRLMLLDEPSLGLAPLIAARIFEVIQGLNRQGVAVLLIEQNARAALQVAHRGYVIENGRIVQEGNNLAKSRAVQEAYLGSAPGVNHDTCGDSHPIRSTRQ